MPSAKKERSKKKKAAKCAAPAGIEAAAARIKAANATPQLSDGLEAFLSIDLSGGHGAPIRVTSGGPSETSAAALPTAATAAPHPVHLEICASQDVALADARGMYDLLKDNMHDMYVEAGWGWDEAEKWREMEHRDARFVIARCRGSGGEKRGTTAAARATPSTAAAATAASLDGVAGGGEESDAEGVPAVTIGEAVLPAEESEGEQLAGFCHFRFAWDEDENEDGEGVGGKEDVLYVYELQVAPWAKRRGLGRRMMQALELLANRHSMSKVMLTVFKENEQAVSFYTKKMKYARDKASPSNWGQPDEVYEILSKPTRQGAAREKEAQRAAAL